MNYKVCHMLLDSFPPSIAYNEIQNNLISFENNNQNCLISNIINLPSFYTLNFTHLCSIFKKLTPSKGISPQPALAICRSHHSLTSDLDLSFFLPRFRRLLLNFHFLFSQSLFNSTLLH